MENYIIPTGKIHLTISRREGLSCPICEQITNETGNLSSQIITIVGEKICDNCKFKIRELIGIKK